MSPYGACMSVCVWLDAWEEMDAMSAKKTNRPSPVSAPRASDTVLTGRWLVVARVAWVVVFVTMLAAFFIQIPYYL